jgi:hypothetical protein
VKPAIEDESRGARVDVSFRHRGRDIAVEVELSDGHAVENVTKDLRAGFDVVVCLLEDPSCVRTARKLTQATVRN